MVFGASAPKTGDSPPKGVPGLALGIASMSLGAKAEDTSEMEMGDTPRPGPEGAAPSFKDEVGGDPVQTQDTPRPGPDTATPAPAGTTSEEPFTPTFD
jgi:hypothetical protein